MAIGLVGRQYYELPKQDLGRWRLVKFTDVFKLWMV